MLYRHAVPVFSDIGALTRRESDLFWRVVTGRADDDTGDGRFRPGFQRTVILNGLRPPPDHAHLLGRIMILELDRLTPQGRGGTDRIEAAFQAARPRLFGGLLNALSRTLALLPGVNVEDPSGVTDFQRFGRAAAVALGSTQERFDASYGRAASSLATRRHLISRP